MFTELDDRIISRFRASGIISLPLIDPDMAKSWAIVIRAASDGGVVNQVETEFGEKCDYRILEADQLTQIVPVLDLLYSRWREPLSDLLGENVLCSPWRRSSINANIYGSDENECGLHTDSNPLTILLSLTDGEPLEFCGGLGVLEKHHVAPGRALIFNGKAHAHRVSGGPLNANRITLPFNYYTEDDCSRPDGWDDHVYGNKNFKDLNGTS